MIPSNYGTVEMQVGVDPMWVGLTEYFTFNETGGTTATDSISGYTMNHNGAVPTSGGINNYGIDVQSGDYPRLTTNTAFTYSKSTAFTISFWVKFSGSGTRVLFDRQENSATRRGYELYLSSGNLYFNLFGNSTTNWWSVNVTNPMPSTGVWYHVVWTSAGTGSATGLKCYINGSSKTVNIGSNNISTYDFNGTANFTFGAYWDNLYATLGVMDELASWNGRELSSSEVTTLYNSGTGKFYE